MQIHEITRRALSEAGILGTIANKAVSGLTNKLLPGAAPDQNLVGAPVSGNLRQSAAGQMNKTLLAPLAKEMQKRWAQNVQQLLAKSVDANGNPATSAAHIKPDALEKEMYLFLNALVGFDIGKIASMDDGSGQAKQLDSELKPQVTAAIAATQKPNPNLATNIWLPLATSIQRAKSINQFASGTGKSGPGKFLPVTGTGQQGKVLVNGQPYNKTDPQHVASVQAAGIDPTTLK